MAWQAATLDERLAATSAEEPHTEVPVPREVEAFLRGWVRLFAGGDEGAFRRRLEWDGWTAGAVRTALAAPPPADFTASWTDYLARILAAAADAAGHYRSATWESEVRALGGDADPDLPFVDAWLPFVRVALAAACASPAAGVVLLAQARDAFGRQLALDLASASSLVLFEAFQEHGGERSASTRSAGGDRSRYDEFLRHLFTGGLARIFAEYPALARHLAWLVESRAAALQEMLARLEEDAAAIESSFGQPVGPVTAALTGLSDPHAGGRRVVILQFASGWQLAYKPRDVVIEEAFNGFLRWCRAEGLDDLPAPLVVLPREGYGWMEVARREELADEPAVEAYYRRAGGLVCVAHLLRGHDLHGENIIATGSGPVLVDAEALCQPVRPAETPAGGDANAAASLRDQPVESCLYTGLVTLRHPDAAGVYYDVGGLRPSGPRRVAAGRARWRGLRSDALQYEVCREAAPVEGNVPAYGGQARPPQPYRAAIVDGFVSAYRFLEARRDQLLSPGGPLAPFGGPPVRVLFRPSDRYAALLRVLAAPRYWRSGIERGIASDALNRVFAREVSRPPLWAFAAEERKALEQGDIPRFTVASDAQHAVAASGERVAGYFQGSGLDAVRARVGAMNERDLSRQAAWLDAALRQDDDAHPVGASQQPTGATDVFVQAAERLGEELLRRGQRGAGNPCGWPVLGDRLDLYDGLAGPMLFFAALGRTLGGDWREVAASVGLALAEGIPNGGRWQTLRGVGAGTGLGSLVYSLAVAGALIDEPGLIAAARRAASAIADRLPECADFDVVDGLAGAVLALVALSEMTGDAAVLDQAAACARILVTRQVPCGEGRAWPSRDGHVRAGFAHGAAGAAYALVRFAAASGWAPARSAAVEALAFERSRYSAADRNWPAIRSDGGTAIMTAWCHGAAGIGLGRAMMRGLFDEGGIEQEMRQAAETVIASGSAGLDHLCCGTLSRVESLLTAGARAGQPAWVEAARALAAPVARRLRDEGIVGARTGGFEYGLFQPGFFQGVSGVGYELLRVSQPSLLPSVAGFEAPAWRH